MEDRPITSSELSQLETALDRLWSTFNIDIEFTRHFLDRVNDPRNKKQITIQELMLLFRKVWQKFGKKLSNLKFDDIEAVLTDINTSINVPFVLRYDQNKGELELISKTVMRKANFMTRNKKYVVEGVKTYRQLMEELNESHKIKTVRDFAALEKMTHDFGDFDIRPMKSVEDIRNDIESYNGVVWAASRSSSGKLSGVISKARIYTIQTYKGIWI